MGDRRQETFAKSKWQAEISISFKDLGISTPTNGQLWRVNFCRDWDIENGRDKVTKWTSWSPPTGEGNFNDPEGFGYLYFREDAPVIKVSSLGDPLGGDIEVAGSVANVSAKAVRLSAGIVASISESKKEIINKQIPISLPSLKEEPIKIKESIALKRSLPMLFSYIVTDSGTKEVLYRNFHRFTALPAFRVATALYYSRKIVEIDCDISRLSDLPSSFSAAVKVFRSKDDCLVNSIPITELSDKARTCNHALDISKLEPGNYVVKVFLSDGGAIIAQRNEEFVIPEKPEWWGNQLGVSDQVPPPWSPVEVKGTTVSVWGRDYQFLDGVFPSQIINQKAPMLSAPMSLEIVTDHGVVKWEKSELEIVSKTDAKAKLRITNSSPLIKMVGDIEAEYDGFVRIDFALSSKSPVVIKSMALHIPIREDSAIYMKGVQFYPKSLGYAACLYDGAKGEMAQANIWTLSSKGWLWKNDFMHYIWVGGDTTGISVSFDSNKGFQTTKNVEVLNKKNTKEVVISFIDSPYVVKEPLTYTLALHATPVKPLPKDPKRFHFGYSYEEPASADKGFYACTTYAGLDRGPGWPGLTEKGKTKVKEFWQKDIRVFPDGYYWLSSAELPEFKLFGKEWEMNPPYRIPNYGLYKATATGVCRKGSYADFMLWVFNKKIHEGMKGLYNDGANLFACDAESHDCGYVNADGKRVATVSLFETRELYKRVYTLFKSKVPDSFIFVHNVPTSPLASFTDGTCEGESWSEGDYSNLLPDLFRAGFATYNQLGIPFDLYPFVSYGWRYPDGKPHVPPEELLPITLSYNIYPLAGAEGNDNNVGLIHLNPVWEIMDEWRTTSEWIPYWKSRPWAVSSDDNVKVSLYRKENEKKALLLITNLEKESVQGSVAVNLARFRIDNGKVKLTKVTPAKIEIKDKQQETLSPMRKEEIPLNDGKINVSLPRRSMQFYLLEEKGITEN
ncbi:MAG: glycoside hydrolase domain-containing protein [Phycisphaerae bacterium]